MKGVIIGLADTDEEAGVLLFISGVDFAFCVEHIAEPHGIGALVFIAFHPE